MKHVHAELMALYAEDAMVTATPWELWEFKANLEEEWTEPLDNLRWQPLLQYRRKPKTININGFEVPEPYRGEIKEGQKYYSVDPQVFLFQYGTTWCDDSIDRRCKDRGFIHLTQEAAVLHSKALASFTSGESND